MSDPSETVTDLASALTSLEAALDPLLASTYEEVSNPTLDPLQKAKLDVIVGYVVHDLIWIYLRTCGVDPASHPVMQELERLKKYFDKIHSTTTKKDAPRFTIDKAAAGRFIAAAIASGRPKVDPSYTDVNAEAGPSNVHTRFEDDKSVKRMLMEDEEEEVVEEEEKVEEEEMEVVEEMSSKASSKSQRPKMDPFAGYDQPKVKDSKSKKSSKRALEATVATEELVVAPTVAEGEPVLTKKQLKKLAKKAKTTA